MPTLSIDLKSASMKCIDDVRSNHDLQAIVMHSQSKGIDAGALLQSCLCCLCCFASESLRTTCDRERGQCESTIMRLSEQIQLHWESVIDKIVFARKGHGRAVALSAI
jgi:hypothetical protein